MSYVSGDGYFNEVKPPNSGNAVSFTESIGTTAVEVRSGASRLEKRRGVYLKNNSDTVMLWGFSNTTCYIPLAAITSGGDGGEIWVDVGDQQAIWVQVAAGSGKELTAAEIK